MDTKESLVNRSLRQQIKGVIYALRLPFMAIIIGLVVGGIVIAFSGSNPFLAIWGILKGGYGSGYLLFTTLTRATPIIFAGLSAALIWGSGYDSMGIGGQMTGGALVSAVVAAACPGPGIVVIIVTLLAGAAAGILYSLVPTWLKLKFGASLLIVTLMLNYVADYLTTYFTVYVFKDPNGADSSAIQTAEITAALPKIISQYSLHIGFVFALIVVALLYLLKNRTVFGYQARIGGLNSRFADYGGINSTKMTYMVLSLSAAIAGMGGAIEVLGNKHRFVDQMITSPGFAWSGITASIMSNYHPVGTMLSSIFLAGLSTGGSYMERNMGIPGEVSTIIQGVITMLVTIKLVVNTKKKHDKIKEGK